MHARATLAPLAAALALSLALLPACVDQQRQTTEGHDVYTLMGTTEIEGRQGIAQDGEHRWVSDSDALYLYDADWNLIAKNDTPFATGIAPSANHISDIDVYDGHLYCGIEHFENAKGSDIQIAVYDAQSLTFQRTFFFEPASGQDEISGVTVNPAENTLVACSWTQSGAYLYRYDLSSGNYLNRVVLWGGPQHIQGIAYREGAYYLTADDGNEDAGEPDHVYRATFGPSSRHPARSRVSPSTRSGASCSCSTTAAPSSWTACPWVCATPTTARSTRCSPTAWCRCESPLAR